MSLLSFLVNFIVLLSLGISASSSNNTEGNGTKEDCPCTRSLSKSHCPCRDDPCDPFHARNAMIHGTGCMCNLGIRGVPLHDDYHYTPGIGAHKFHTRARVWNEARKVCNEEGGHLAIINSFAEAHALMDIFNRSGPVKGSNNSDEALLGIHDLYTEGDWNTVLGDSLAKTGYTDWSDKWGGQPDNGGGIQNCGAFLKEGQMDDVSCDIPYPFFCELSCTSLF